MYSIYCRMSFCARQARLFSMLFFVFLCAFFGGSLSQFSLSLASQEVQSDKKVIRIGYEGNFGIFQANGTPGNEGYGYELFQELMKYTKNRLQSHLL